MVSLAISEKAFQANVERLARYLGWRAYHTHDSRRSSAGFPDLVLLRDTRVLVAELKSETGRVRAEQREWLEAFELAGVEAHLWRPSDWADIERTLRP